MTRTYDIRSRALKLMRVFLVFALVFYTSLRVELLVAYGADLNFDNVIEDNGTGHDDAALTDLLVYERSGGSDEWKPVNNARATGSDPAKVSLSASDADQQFIVVPVWDDVLPSGYGAGDGLKAAIYSATFTEWELSPADASCVSADRAPGKNVLILTPQKNGEVTVKAKLKSGRSENLAVSFKVEVSGFESDKPQPKPEEKPAELTSVEVLDKDGQTFDQSGEYDLVFSKDDLPVDYQLGARVSATGGVLGDKGVYDSLSDGSLAAFSHGVLGDLEWTVSGDSDIATIDESGALKVTGEGKFDVTCVASVKEGVGQQMSGRIRVLAGNPQDEEDDPQGASHPQDSLHIVSNGSLSQPAGDDESGEANQEGVAAQDDEAVDEAAAIDRTFTLEELNQLEGLTFTTETYEMNVAGRSTAITGNGFALNDLLRIVFDEAGVNPALAPIESIDFVDYRGVATTIPYSVLQGASALVAVKSHVDVSDEPDANSGEKSPEAAESNGDGGDGNGDDNLLDNTRFRLLFNAGSSEFNADDLRWINTIQINGATQDADDLSVRIDYTPVPKGIDAEFVAVPGFDITGSWNCIWEASYDGGLTWSELEEETGQTLRVPTSDATIGNWYRVTIDNEAVANDDHLKGTSESVELREGVGVVLSYTPPRAGDLAIFRSSVYGYDGDIAQLDYVWQWSNDGGRSWNVIEGESGPTLKLPTDPVDESAGSGDDASSEPSPSNLIYIRVRAIPPQGDPLVSNVQPLTVRVGDEDTDTGSGDDSGSEGGEDKPAGGEVNPPSGGPSQSGTTQQPTPTVTEIQNITMEYSPTPTEQLNPDANNQQQAAPQNSGAPTEIYVNDAVSDLVNEQQEAVQEYMASTTPGVRWTALNTVNPTGDDVRRVLDGNPIAPLVIPFSLGTLVAGGLEKLLVFRRQLL